MDTSGKYIMAEGPDRLEQALESLLEKSQADPVFAKADHFILYRLNTQKTLLKVDTSERPFQIWYYDMMGRPASVVVKEAITRFLWERCGGKELYKEGVE